MVPDLKGDDREQMQQRDLKLFFPFREESETNDICCPNNLLTNFNFDIRITGSNITNGDLEEDERVYGGRLL